MKSGAKAQIDVAKSEWKWWNLFTDDFIDTAGPLDIIAFNTYTLLDPSNSLCPYCLEDVCTPALPPNLAQDMPWPFIHPVALARRTGPFALTVNVRDEMIPPHLACRPGNKIELSHAYCLLRYVIATFLTSDQKLRLCLDDDTTSTHNTLALHRLWAPAFFVLILSEPTYAYAYYYRSNDLVGRNTAQWAKEVLVYFIGLNTVAHRVPQEPPNQPDYFYELRKEVHSRLTLFRAARLAWKQGVLDGSVDRLKVVLRDYPVDIIDQYSDYSFVRVLFVAASIGSLELLKFLEEHYEFSIPDYFDAQKIAADSSKGYPILKYLFKERGILPDQDALNATVRRNDESATYLVLDGFAIHRQVALEKFNLVEEIDWEVLEIAERGSHIEAYLVSLKLQHEIITNTMEQFRATELRYPEAVQLYSDPLIVTAIRYGNVEALVHLLVQFTLPALALTDILVQYSDDAKRVGVLEILIENGANVNINVDTLFENAIQIGSFELMDMYIRNGARILRVLPALLLAATRAERADMTKHLLDAAGKELQSPSLITLHIKGEVLDGHEILQYAVFHAMADVAEKYSVHTIHELLDIATELVHVWGARNEAAMTLITDTMSNYTELENFPVHVASVRAFAAEIATKFWLEKHPDANTRILELTQYYPTPPRRSKRPKRSLLRRQQ